MKPEVLLVSHDAGGAEVLSAWMSEHKDIYEISCCLGGPALDIFSRDFSPLPLSGLKLISSMSGDDFVLTGSSLEADLERRAIAEAKKQKIHCVTFLDHWDLYRERFGSQTNWKKCLPDEIRVGDSYAFDYALRSGFPPLLLKQVANPYFRKIQKLAAKADQRHVSRQTGLKILYICEPFTRKLNATFSAAEVKKFDNEPANLNKFMQAALLHRQNIESITLRPHPSDPPAMYDSLIEEFRQLLPIALSSEKLLVNDIMANSVVIGIESNALVIGLLLNKPVFSCITGKQWQISLPHREIHRVIDHREIFRQLHKKKE